MGQVEISWDEQNELLFSSGHWKLDAEQIEIIEKINEKYKGKFTEADRVILGALHDKLIKNKKLFSSAISTDPVIFTESIFPAVFGEAAMESYTESEESYKSIFEDKNKYQAIMGALAEVIYREMRKKMNEMPLDMVAEQSDYNAH